jgi:hypothetical protein
VALSYRCSREDSSKGPEMSVALPGARGGGGLNSSMHWSLKYLDNQDIYSEQ